MSTFGRYRLIEPLGSGRLTEAFKAKSYGVEGFEKTLVIKRLLPEHADNAKLVARFVEQGKLAVRLSHANVVQVVDLGQVSAAGKRGTYQATELVSGLSLAVLLERARAANAELPLELALYVAAEIAKACDHAHRRRDARLRPLGLTHGKLHPGNVLVSWEGEVKVSDFGTASAIRLSEVEGSVDPYTSPEVRAHASPTPAADLYALGAILWELLKGESVGGEPPTPERLQSDLVPELAAMLVRALSLEVEQRFASAAEFHESLLTHIYASRARFGAEQLAIFVQRFRDRPPSGVPEALGAALGAPRTSLRPPRAPSEPPGALRDEREIAVLVVHASEAPHESERKRRRVRMERFGAEVVRDEERLLILAFGLTRTSGRETESAALAALSLLHMLGDALAGIRVGVDSDRMRSSESGGLDAVRLEQLFETARELSRDGVGRVAISERAAERLRGAFELESSAGQSGALLISRSRVPEAAFGRFFGRRSELTEIGKRLIEATRGEGRVLGIIGEPGIGKSHLLHEMRRRLTKSGQNVRVYIATCPPRGRDTFASGAVSMLRALCGVRPTDPPDQVATLAPRLRALGLREPEVSSVMAELGGDGGGRRDAAQALQPALARMFKSLSSEGTHVMCWDNAEDLDEQSAAALTGAASELARSRILLLFAARPEAPAHYKKIPGYREINLTGLQPDDAARLVGGLLGVESVPDSLLEFIAQRADGHPMFIGELLRQARETGSVRVEHHRIERLRLDGVLAVPRPLRALLADRVRRLPPVEQNVLVQACVLGQPVDLDALAAMVNASPSELAEPIRRLQSGGLLRRDEPALLAFPTTLLPEVVISELEPDRLRELHEHAAQAYQTLVGLDVEYAYLRTAHHLAEAGQRDAASRLFAKAGAAAIESGRREHAAEAVMSALELCDWSTQAGAEIAEWAYLLTRVSRHASDKRRLREITQRLADHYDRKPSIEQRSDVEALVSASRILAELHHYREARHLLERARSCSTGWPDLERSVLIAQAEVAIALGEFRTAVQLLESAQELGPSGSADRHQLYVVAAQALGGAGDHTSALELLEQAAELDGDTVAERVCERGRVRALILGYQGDWSASAEACQEVVERAHEAGLEHEVALSSHHAGVALLESGDFARSYAALQFALESAEQIGSDRLSNLNRMLLAYLDGINGAEKAHRVLGELLAYAEEQKLTPDVITGRYLLGKLLLADGETEAARRELEIARRMAMESDNHRFAENVSRILTSLVR